MLSARHTLSHVIRVHEPEPYTYTLPFEGLAALEPHPPPPPLTPECLISEGLGGNGYKARERGRQEAQGRCGACTGSYSCCAISGAISDDIPPS